MSTHDPFTDPDYSDDPNLERESADPFGEDGEDVEDVDGSSALRLRPPPPGLSRADRRQWRRLEVGRVQRDSEAAARAAAAGRTGWRQGFIEQPPRGIGRTGRRAWLQAERESTRQFWRSRRASTADLPERAAGVLVVAVVLGIGLLVLALTSGRDDAPSAPAAAAVTAALPSAVTTSPTLDAPLSARLPASSVSEDPQVSGSAGLPSVVGRWDPAPATGVAAVAVSSAPPADAGTVVTDAAPTGPVTAQEQATPDGALRAWLTRTCPSTWTDAYGADSERGRALMTTAGWRGADPTDDAAGAAAWAQVVAARQTRTCGELTVQVSAGAAPGGGSAFVGYRAVRVVMAPDAAPVTEQLSGTRVVRQSSDGRWFVDVPAVGG